jgi:hypothetical protein
VVVGSRVRRLRELLSRLVGNGLGTGKDLLVAANAGSVSGGAAIDTLYAERQFFFLGSLVAEGWSSFRLLP